MKILKVSVCAVAMASSLLSLSALAETPHHEWKPAYGGGHSAEELMVLIAEDALAQDPNATVEFEFTVDVVVDGVQIVDDLAGLPSVSPESNEIPMTSDGQRISQATISVPFSTENYFVDGRLDSTLMLGSLGDTLANLREKPSLKNKHKTGLQSHPSNASNCGGYPLGSTFSASTSNCLAKITSTYQCMPNANGGKDWFLISQDILPAEYDCISP